MEWLSENWVWVLIGVAFIAMHMFGHGGHGRHGGHGGGSCGGRRTSDDSAEPRDADAPSAHRH